MLGRRALLMIAGALALVTAAIAALYVAAAPTPLKIAVAEKSEDLRLVEGLRQVLDRERANVRLKVAQVADLKAAADAIEKGEADLAVVRTDVAVPPNGQTVAVMHEDAAIIVAPEPAKISDMADLAGKRLGIVMRHPADEQLIRTIITRYGFSPTDVMLKPLAPDDVLKQVADHRVDAVALVGPPTDPEIASLVNAIDQITDGTVVIVPVPQADAMAQRSSVLQASKLVAGSFGGLPPRPLEEVKTIAVTYRLIARASLDDSTVAHLTRLIFEMRPRLARTQPLANLIDAPDTAKSAALPIHPGAANYLDDEEETFLERYSDWIYILMAAGGVLGSVTAALASRFTQRKDERADRLLERLLSILKEARPSGEAEQLDLLSLEVDVIVAESVHYARHSGISPATFHALSLAIEGARSAIAEQRSIVGKAAAARAAQGEMRLTAVRGGAARPL